MNTCKHCKNPYNKAVVKNSLGEYSSPYLGGYCSAGCYTRATVKSHKEARLTEIKGHEIGITVTDRGFFLEVVSERPFGTPNIFNQKEFINLTGETKIDLTEIFSPPVVEKIKLMITENLNK